LGVYDILKKVGFGLENILFFEALVDGKVLEVANNL
jgi:hypothetical protein